MIIRRIVDYLWNRKSIKSFYCFYQNSGRNPLLIWNVCFLSWCIGHDRELKKSIHSHVIGVTFGLSLFLFRVCHDFTDRLSKIFIGQWYIVTIIMFNYSFQQISMVFMIWVAMHASSYITSIMLKIFLPHSNMLLFVLGLRTRKAYPNYEAVWARTGLLL